MNKKLLIAGLSILTVFAACSKDDDPSVPVKTKKEILQSKWLIDRQLFVTEPADTFNYTGTATDYADFKADGKVYISYGGEFDTLDYQFNGIDSIYIDGEDWLITNFTETRLSMYSFDGTATDFEKVWLDLKK